MATNITNFREKFSGVRPNRFTINGNFPSGTGLSAPELSIYCKATQLPGSSIGVIPVPWMGRVVKFSGERSYADWTLQIYDSSIAANELRAGFEKWIELMDGRDTHKINYSKVEPWTITYMDMNGTESGQGNPTGNRQIKLNNCFPVDISPVDLSYDAVDTFSEFTVTMAYDFWESHSGS
jgi:hypothetical protein